MVYVIYIILTNEFDWKKFDLICNLLTPSNCCEHISCKVFSCTDSWFHFVGWKQDIQPFPIYVYELSIEIKLYLNKFLVAEIMNEVWSYREGNMLQRDAAKMEQSL